MACMEINFKLCHLE